MKTQLSHVVAAVFSRPWFIRPEVLREIGAIVNFHVAGGRYSQDELAERLAAAAARNGPRTQRATGDVGHIPVYGMIAPRATLMTEMSGGTTVEAIRGQLRAHLADETVGSILLEFDSPGGYTDGVEELATEIRNARGTKPIVALSNYQMASAAYYLGSQADEVVATPSSVVGWIGTAMIHTEFSKMDEAAGVTTTILRNPEGKLGGNEFEPLSEKARTEMQELVDEYSSAFVSAVAKGRGVSAATVRSDFGQGGGMSASRAKAAGLVDRVDTFDATVKRMGQGRITMRPVGAIAEPSASVAIAEAAGADVDVDDQEPIAPPIEPTAPPADDVDELALEAAIASRRRR